jgi:hypothetical protein
MRSGHGGVHTPNSGSVGSRILDVGVSESPSVPFKGSSCVRSLSGVRGVTELGGRVLLYEADGVDTSDIT